MHTLLSYLGLYTIDILSYNLFYFPLEFLHYLSIVFYLLRVSHRVIPFSILSPSDAVSQAAPSLYYRLVHFDVSGVDIGNSTVVKAEFRIFRAPNPQARAAEQRVEIFQVEHE